MMLVITVLGTFAGIVAFIINIMVEQYTSYGASLSGIMRRFTGEDIGFRDLLQNTAGFLGPLFGTLWTSLGMLVLIFFLVLLFLLELSEWKSKVHDSFKNTYRDKILETITVSAEKVRRFLLVMTFISAVSGVAIGLLLLIAGMRYAVVWGFIAFALNYVPYLGSFVVVLLVSLIALLELDTTGALLTIGGLVLINAVVGNYLAPRLEGNALFLSPWVVLMSLIFWGWLWGAAGALIGIPLTVSIVVACDNIPSLQPLARVLKKAE
jgi:predicted PurR-regulated permease PerM